MDSGHDDIAKMLLDRKGCGMDLADREGDTALHLATRHSNKKLAAVLLRKGANADLKNFAGDLPLTEAIRSGDLTMAQVCSLLFSGWGGRALNLTRYMAFRATEKQGHCLFYQARHSCPRHRQSTRCAKSYEIKNPCPT